MTREIVCWTIETPPASFFDHSEPYIEAWFLEKWVVSHLVKAFDFAWVETYTFLDSSQSHILD